MKCLIENNLWKLKIDLFGATVYCVLAERSEDWVKYLNPVGYSLDGFNNLKDRVRQAAEATQAATVSNGKTVIVLFQKDPLSHELIVHECVHAAYDLAKGAGISDTNNEVEAYLTAHLFEKISKVVFKKIV